MKLTLSPMFSLSTLYSLFGKPVPVTPEAVFWQWFQKNEDAMFDVERDRERNFERLAAELHKVHPALAFEFGPRNPRRRDFVISADGKRAAFSEVERLHAAAPLLPKWNVIKFRQRGAAVDLEYMGMSVKADSVKAILTPGRDKLDVAMIIPGCSDAERETYTGIAFLMLDKVLGEYDVETRIGTINVQPLAPQQATAIPLDMLAAAVDAHFARRR